MRTFLTGLCLFGLPVLWLLAIWWFLRSPRPGTLSALTLGDFLHVITAVFTLAAIVIAVASYQHAVTVSQRALAVAEEQGRVLEEQRQALDASRRSLEQLLATAEKGQQTPVQQVEAPERTPEALEAELEPARQPQDNDRPRVAGRPHLEFSLDDVDWSQLRTGASIKMASRGGKMLADLAIRNVGDTALRRPTVSLRALPSTVRIDPARFSGTGSSDIPSTAVGGGEYTYTFTMSVPADVKSFVLLVVVAGDNFERQTVRIPIEMGGR